MPPPPTSEASPLNSPTTSKSVASQDPIEKGEHNFHEQLNILLQCSCLKHITNPLDDIFELNFDQTELKCIFCYDETSTGVLMLLMSNTKN